MLAIDGLHVHLNIHSRLYSVFALDTFFGISSSTELHEVEQAFGAVDCYAFYNDRCLIEIAQYAPFFFCLADTGALICRVSLNVAVLGIILLDLFV